MKRKIIILLALIAIFFCDTTLFAQTAESANSASEVGIKVSLEGESFGKAINIFILMTILSLVPSIIMMMTSFTRILIVLSFLKKAMGTMQTPSAKIVAALSLFLTIFIMQPVWTKIYEESIEPYSKEEISSEEAINKAVDPIKEFMLRQTRDSSLLLFIELSETNLEDIKTEQDLPMTVIVPAFMISELKTAFQMGFLIYLPFLLIDIVVATTLMSMGMMMLPPMMISMPFKLLLFILVDGWGLVIKSLVNSFA